METTSNARYKYNVERWFFYLITTNIIILISFNLSYHPLLTF